MGQRGRVLILAGARELSVGADTPAWLGGSGGGRFGASLAAGDLDGDRRPELIVGAPGSDHARGAVVWVKGGEATRGGDLQSAKPAFALQGSLEHERFGAALATADLDGDGIDELIVGAPGSNVGTTPEAGRVLVYRGRKAWPEAVEPDLIVVGRERENLGTGLVTGDFDADGIPDLAMLSPALPHRGLADAGAVTVIHGRKGLLRERRELTLGQDAVDLALLGRGKGRFGSAACVADVDGDGKSDILVAEPLRDFKTDRQAGAVHAFPGGSGVNVDLATGPREPLLRGGAIGENFGSTLLVIENAGARLLAVGSPPAGRVVLLSLPLPAKDPSPSPRNAFMPGGSSAGRFGASLVSGELGGADKVKVAIGAPGASRVYVYDL